MTTCRLRSGFLIAVVLLIAATPAAAQEKVCRGQHAPKPPLTPAQKEQAELESYAKQRAEFGFRHDIKETIENDASAGDGFFDGYGDAGFSFAGIFFDDTTATLEVHVRTPRTDAAAYFAAHYGPLVAVEVVGDRFECRS